MQHDYWLSKWEQGQIGFHEPGTNAWLERYAPTVFPTPGRVFVPLCGKALDMAWLAGQGHEVVGIELAEIAVRQFFDEAGLNPVVEPSGALTRYSARSITLYAGDFFDLSAAELGTVDYVYDRAALVAVAPSERQRYAASLTALVPDGARGLLVTLDYDQDRMDGPPFSVPPDEVESLFAGRARVRLKARNEDALDSNRKFRERGLTELAESAYELIWTD